MINAKHSNYILSCYRLNTRNLLRKNNMVLRDRNCVRCNRKVEETLSHLFFEFECSFSQRCWRMMSMHAVEHIA